MTAFSAPLCRMAAPEEIRTNRREALRYLGYGSSEPDDSVQRLLASCEKELLSAVQGRACWLRVPVAFPAAHTVDVGFGPVESVSLAKHLAGCHSALLFAATIGIAADRLIGRWSRLSPSHGVVVDALASSAVESWCDLVEAELTREEDRHCERFSPGYGDFALHHQRDLVSRLDAARLIGVSLTDSLLLMPSKSVTAIIGLGASSRTCGHKCLYCSKENCIYREVLV